MTAPRQDSLYPEDWRRAVRNLSGVLLSRVGNRGAREGL